MRPNEKALEAAEREIKRLKEAFALQARISIQEFRAKCALEADLHLQQQEIERLKGELHKRNLSSFLVGASGAAQESGEN